jgi:hypothetical protein
VSLPGSPPSGAPRPATDAGALPSTRVTLREWAATIGRSYDTIRVHWVGTTVRNPETGADVSFPTPVGRRSRPAGVRGRGEAEYEEAALDRFLRAKRAASPQGRGGARRTAEDYDPDEWIADRVSADRLGIPYDTFRRYPSLYRRGDNQLPVKNPDGNRRWGDVLAWNERRSGSGRFGARPTPDRTVRRIPERGSARNTRPES